MWDDWDRIASAQARAAREDEERRQRDREDHERRVSARALAVIVPEAPANTAQAVNGPLAGPTAPVGQPGACLLACLADLRALYVGDPPRELLQEAMEAHRDD